MGTSSLPPCPVSPSSLSLPPLLSPLDDCYTTPTSDRPSDQRFPHDGLNSSTSGSSSSSSSSYRPKRRSFLHSNGLHSGLHLQTRPAYSQLGGPVLSSNSGSKEMAESPLNTNSGCISAITNYSMPNCNASEGSAPQHFQASHSGFNQLGNSVVKPLEEITTSCSSSIVTSASTVALSSPASAGGGVTKVSKRRTRINKKVPIAVLSADTSNFRAMVQQLTGIPPSHASPHIWGSPGAPLLRPQPTRFAYNGGLPTLDTSAAFLGSRQMFPFLQGAQHPFMNGLLQDGASNNVGEFTSCQGRGKTVNYDTSSSFTSLPGLWDTMGNDPSSDSYMKGNMKELSAANLVRECEQSFPRQASSLFESLLMSEDDVQAKSSANAVDSWLAFDGAAFVNHSPRLDRTKIVS